jgi:hypothetical protein
MDLKIYIDTELGNDEYDGSSWELARKTVPVEAIEQLVDFDVLNIEVKSSTPLELPVPRGAQPNTTQIIINEHAR